MTIVKELKHVMFSWFPEKRILLITQRPIGTRLSQVDLSRKEFFSLARFILRIAQKGKPIK